MVVRMMKWPPWPATVAPAASKKFQVKVKHMKLEGFDDDREDVAAGGGSRERVMAVKVKWKGEPKHGLVPFHRRHQESSTERHLKKGEPVVWSDEFQNICSFPAGSADEAKSFRCDVAFKLLYGDHRKGKKAVIGKVLLNLTEIIMNMESPVVERKLPINFEVAGIIKQATISVTLSIIEIRDFQHDLPELVREPGESASVIRTESVKDKNQKKKQLSAEDVNLCESDESTMFDSEGVSETRFVTESGVSSRVVDPVKKVGFFNWKRRRLSFRPVRTKAEPLIIKTTDPQCSGSSSVDLTTSGQMQKANAREPYEPNKQEESSTTASWEAKEFTSRDGKAKLNAEVFFASFDQRSDKAAGESACSVLVTVIAHWLQSNQDAMPTRTQFDRLIIEGSSEWQKLCEDVAYVTEFPNKHFDLETVLRASLRPITVSHDRSFVGFFGPEKFECLRGAMSFDEIWDEISRYSEENEPRVYIVSWNDHFFVLKADVDAYYIIDTLGERLFEGCNQAYILRFDESSVMQEKAEEQKGGSGTTSPGKESEALICKGKECCREFIKMFLAAIPLEDLEMEEKKESVPYYALHHRLQIEFNFSIALSSPSTSISVLSTSTTASTSSLFSDEESLI